MIFKILTSRFDKFVPNCCMRYIGHKISLHIFESLKMEKYLIKSKVHENVYATSKSSQSHCFGLFLGNVCSFFSIAMFSTHRFCFKLVVLEVRIEYLVRRKMFNVRGLCSNQNLKKNIGTLIHLATFFFSFVHYF